MKICAVSIRRLHSGGEPDHPAARAAEPLTSPRPRNPSGTNSAMLATMSEGTSADVDAEPPWREVERAERDDGGDEDEVAEQRERQVRCGAPRVRAGLGAAIHPVSAWRAGVWRPALSGGSEDPPYVPSLSPGRGVRARSIDHHVHRRRASESSLQPELLLERGEERRAVGIDVHAVDADRLVGGSPRRRGAATGRGSTATRCRSCR